jgi:hypothetical protein
VRRRDTEEGEGEESTVWEGGREEGEEEGEDKEDIE